MTMQSGIYVIECAPTKKIYVGSAVNIRRKHSEAAKANMRESWKLRKRGI